MFDEVLKFGSMIVDALVAYQQPLFVYIPPHAELRGGAWVVVDSTINSDVMEFYAAENARGGVLEAAGAASIKFREKDIILAAHRLDHVLQALDKDIARISRENLDTINGKTLASLQMEVKEREKSLFGVYQQVAVHFADLHDTPGRMKAKGVIRRQVDWKDSRSFFYYRVRRRLTEFDFANAVKELNPIGHKDAIELLYTWFLSCGGSASLWEDDKGLLSWFSLNNHQSQLHTYLSKLRDNALVNRISDSLQKVLVASRSLSGDNTEFISNILKSSLASLPDSDREKIIAAFK